MTKTCSMYTVVSAIDTAEKAFLGPDRTWQAKNEMQERFISNFLSKCRLDLVKIPEFETIAALSEGPINHFLRDKGFDIQLDPFPVLAPPDRAWGAASVLDLNLRWVLKGTKTKIRVDNQEHPAAKLSDDAVSVRLAKGHAHPVAKVETVTKDVVFMTVCDQDLDNFELVKLAEKISGGLDAWGTHYEGLIFPMVDLNHQVDISWLKEMFTIDDEGYFNKITQALQQTKLKMNHEGAHIKDAVAIGGIRCTSVQVPHPPLVIDKPFLFWVERPGLAKPLFVARLTEEVWKDPGSLEM